jgi:hypothetical protein
MIQRIQSIYLLLGVLCLGGLLLYDIVRTGPAAAAYAWYAPAVLALDLVGIGLALFAIFLYKNRPRQRGVVLLAQVVTLLLMVVLYGGLFLAGELQVFREGAAEIGPLVFLLLPVTAYILFYLARKGVEKDIEVVRSMDRLR